jgi:SAM-dependent methyltransferase
MDKDSFKKSLEKIASEYHLNAGIDDKIFDDMFHNELAKKISSLLSPGLKVLELGYGEGTVSSKVFSDYGVDRHIIEGSKALAISAARILGDQVTVHSCLFSEFEPKERFDLVLATNVFEHVENTQELFELIHEWLLPDGVCVITVPNSESFHRKLAVKMGLQVSTKDLSPRDFAVGHLRVYDLAQLSHEVRLNGFKIVRSEGMVIKFLSNSLQLKLPREVIAALHKLASEYPAEYAANLYLEISKK